MTLADPHPAIRTRRARRAQAVLRQLARRPMTTPELERALRPENLADQDPAAHGLRVRAAIDRLQREGRLTPCAQGWRLTDANPDRAAA